jgi:septal ring factor EnvC (AmiA/AmiB activator)
MSREGTAPLEALLSRQSERHQAATDINNSLRSMHDAQASVAEELGMSLPNIEDLEGKLNEAEATIQHVNARIRQSEDLLAKLLSAEVDIPVKPGPILVSVLENTQSLMLDHLRSAVSQGKLEISVLDILNIEEQLLVLIEEMEKRDAYPESSTDREARLLVLSEHNSRITQFHSLLPRP